MPNAQALFDAVTGDFLTLLACARSEGKVVVVAHRGGMAPGHPENSMAAISRALQAAPVVLELDVVSSLDGVLYLHHDDTLDRTTNGSGDYDSLEWNEIKDLVLVDNDRVATGERPLSLRVALDVLKQGAFLMLDLKDFSATKEAVAMVNEIEMLQSTVFIVYTLDQAELVRMTQPDAYLALGVNASNGIDAIYGRGLADTPFVILSGPVTELTNSLDRLTRDGHYLLGGAYVGSNPPDARLETDSEISEMDAAGNYGYQLVVSNRAVSMAQYLNSSNVLLTPADCQSE